MLSNMLISGVKKGPCRQKGFQTRLQSLLWSCAVSDRLGVERAVYMFSCILLRTFKEAAVSREEGQVIIIMKAGGFPGLLVCQQRIQSQDRQSPQDNLQVPEDHLRNICVSHAPGAAPWSTKFGHALSVPLLAAPGFHQNNVTHCLQQRAERSLSPSPEKSVMTRNMWCQCKSSPQLGIGRMCSRYHPHRAGTEKLLCPQLPRNCRQFESQTQKEAHRECRGQAPRERQIQTPESSSQQQVSHTAHGCACSSELNAPITALVTESMEPSHFKDGNISPLCMSCSQKLRLKSWQ